MKTNHHEAVVQQVAHNSTSWIGHPSGETKSRIGGQTFICPQEGDMDAIEILSTHVSNQGAVDLTIHQFDNHNRSWGPVLETSTIEISKSDAGKWISFPIHGLHLESGMSYGFRLKTAVGLIGVGEAARNSDQITTIGGQEWASFSDDIAGKYYSYLSLAFKVELRA